MMSAFLLTSSQIRNVGGKEQSALKLSCKYSQKKREGFEVVKTHVILSLFGGKGAPRPSPSLSHFLAFSGL